MPTKRPIFVAIDATDIAALLGIGALSPEARECLRRFAAGTRSVGPTSTRLAKRALVLVRFTPSIAREVLALARRSNLPEVVMKIRLALARRKPP